MSEPQDESFFRVWDKARTVGEVADKFGISSAAASARACYYRSKGFPLKLMRRGADGLEALAAELAKVKAERDRLREWRCSVTSAVQRPGGCAYDDLPRYLRSLARVVNRLYSECYDYADGAIDASLHDRLCCEVSDSLRPFSRAAHEHARALAGWAPLTPDPAAVRRAAEAVSGEAVLVNQGEDWTAEEEIGYLERIIARALAGKEEA